MKIIYATFIGKDGSLGFVKGKIYQLNLFHAKGKNIVVEDTQEGLRCEYESTVSLLNNWNNLTSKY